MTNLYEFPIRTMSAMTGVSTVTLRAWERRYGLLQPVRTPSGHRLYTPAHVEQVRRVLSLVQRGIPLGRVRPLLEAGAASPEEEQEGGAWQAYQEQMAAAVAAFDESRLDEIYDEALSLHPVDRITHKVIVPLLIRLGERWEGLDGAIGEEHFFSTYLRSKLGARLHNRTRYATGPRLVVACAPGERHEVGLLLFAIGAREAGFRPVLLGADTPLAEVARAVRRLAGDAVVISSSVDPPEGVLDRDLAELVRSVRAPVFVGGQTAVKHRQAVTSAGAIPLGTDLEEGIRLVDAALASREHRE